MNVGGRGGVLLLVLVLQYGRTRSLQSQWSKESLSIEKATNTSQHPKLRLLYSDWLLVRGAVLYCSDHSNKAPSSSLTDNQNKGVHLFLLRKQPMRGHRPSPRHLPSPQSKLCLLYCSWLLAVGAGLYYRTNVSTITTFFMELMQVKIKTASKERGRCFIV